MGDLYVKFGKDHNDAIPLSVDCLYSVMIDEDFLEYCNVYHLSPSKLRSYFAKDKNGNVVSPRWILEFLRDRKPELFVNISNKKVKSLVYNHSKTAVKIFNQIGIPTYEYKK